MSSQTDRRSGERFAASQKRPARRITGAVLLLLILVLSLTRLGVEAFKLLGYADILIGGRNMRIYDDVRKVEIKVPENAEAGSIVQKNDGTTIVYQNRTYELNRNLTTVLFLGIDHEIQETEIFGRGGQSDVILLIGLDTRTGKTTILNISREAYAEVDVYSVDGGFIETRPLQITLAYAYGNGKESSCENAIRSVSRLLYGLPIQSYLAMDMNGIQAANEAVGHVTVKALNDIEMTDGTFFKKGDPIELQGRWLDRYIRIRSKTVIDANEIRMARQVQFVQEFSKLVIARSKASITFPVELFTSLAPYMVTNLEIPDVTFLSSTFLTHGAEFSLRSISGTYDLLNESSVYYLDEMDLFEAVLEFFYTPVD